MSMSRKDYEAVARVLVESGLSTRVRYVLASGLADDFEQTSERFDRRKFISECLREEQR